LKSIFQFIFAPSAFKLGFIITLIFVWLTFSFFSIDSSNSWIVQRLTELHQKSIDVRLRDRGPRPVSDRVAIVTVDELAEERIGRWPWPRGKIAEIIDLLVSYGAKVVAFDAVFVEPDKNQAVVSLSRLKDSKLAHGPLEDLLNTELSQANTDWVLAKAVERHSDHVVMGSYYDEAIDRFDPYQEYCGNLISQKTPQYLKLEKEEKPVVVVDSDTFTVPDIFKDLLNQHFGEIETQTKALWDKEKRNPSDMARAVQVDQIRYCDRWLVTDGEEKDETYSEIEKKWPELRKKAPGFETLSFEDAVNVIKNSTTRNELHRTGRWWMNLPIINEGSKHNAYFNAFLDSDGTVRKSSLIVRYGNVYASSLALKSVLVANDWNAVINLDRDPTDPTSKLISKLSLIDSEGNEVQTLPVDGQGRLLINYAGPDRSFPHLSVAELFNKRNDATISIRKKEGVVKETVNKPEFLKNKILVFGATSTGTYDLRVTPFSENYPGVETHANLIDNILQQSYLVNHHDEGPKMVLTLFTLGLFLSLLLAQMGAVYGLGVTLSILGAIYAIDRFYFFKSGIIVTIILPILLVLSIYVCLTFYKYMTEERKKKAIRGTFEKYVSPAIVNEVLKNPENVLLGGRKEKMTVIFSDVRGFTTISEKLDPQVLSSVLNRYLTPMTALVFKNKGTLDKYMGDAIMAFFGAPIHYPDHAKMACLCALDMINLLPKINEEFKKQGLPTIEIGIGINTGEMSVGNMGSETVRSYTVMGDAVNLGSRLEGINKTYGTRIIISEFTYLEVKDDFVAREVDWVRVKGKMQPVRIFELMALKSSNFGGMKLVEYFEKGFENYHKQDWDNAINYFSRALQVHPADAPSKLYLERSSTYKNSPPPKNWDGVFEMKTK